MESLQILGNTFQQLKTSIVFDQLEVIFDTGFFLGIIAELQLPKNQMHRLVCLKEHEPKEVKKILPKFHV